jgi:hypothetical protein
MSYPARFMLLTIAAMACNAVLAQGLISRLPPDGTWARYKCTTLYWDIDVNRAPVVLPESFADAPKTGNMTVNLLLQSVGTTMVDSERCRWIEIQSRGETVESREIVLRLLVPESSLQLKDDAFDAAKNVFMYDSHHGVIGELEEQARRDYELERFRPYYPRWPKDAEGCKTKFLDGSDAPPDVEFFDFRFDFRGKLMGGRKGTWDYGGDYRTIVGSDAPFGVTQIWARSVTETQDFGKDQARLAIQSNIQIVQLASGNSATSIYLGRTIREKDTEQTDEPEL